ncbi:hypothetical protein [Xenorhabdus bovienii]|uniref:hypothetical protein n=1 Tax=Xenorhabdus bovienii TaxID=40576 RepID=UPI0023B34341|nr:hypothetical protein [Xenorhabdus bovienii]MDE9430164.1 hypothetical protein [Xenorhabdus bovienii]MDE9483752.1 hypothetical protein [Xenorhabdus bovienii]
MNIQVIEWLSKDAEEAILLVNDGQYECTVFSHPCKYNEGNCIENPLLAISVSGIQREGQDSVINIQKQDAHFSHFVIAEVMDKNSNLVRVGNIIIELDEPIPNDINPNDIISFSCNRIDTI